MTGEWIICFILFIGLVAFGLKQNRYVEKEPKDETYEICKSTDTEEELKGD